MKKSRGDGGVGREGVVGKGEGGEEEFVEGVPGMTAVVVNEAEDLVGDGVEKEVGDDYRVAWLVQIVSLDRKV